MAARLNRIRWFCFITLVAASCGSATPESVARESTLATSDPGLSDPGLTTSPSLRTTTTTAPGTTTEHGFEPVAGHAEVSEDNPASVRVDIGMACPNAFVVLEADEGWVFTVDPVVPDDLTFDSVIEHGRWVNESGATVTLRLPGGLVEGEVLASFGEEIDGWENVVVDLGDGNLASGLSPAGGTDRLDIPICAMVLVSDGLSAEELVVFNNTLDVQGDA